MSINMYSMIYVLFVLILFYTIRKELRILALCVSGIGYIAIISKYTLASVLVISILIYFTGLVISYFQNSNKNNLAKAVAYISISLIVISFIFFKACKSIVNISYISNVLHIEENSILYTILIPIGYSFYCFQGIGYIIDIYGKKYHAESNFIYFFTYMSWFPKFISGPIENAETFLKQLRNVIDVELFDSFRIKKSLTYIVIGLFYKLMLADRVAPFVSRIYSEPYGYSGLILILSVIAYSVQIYFDFAGYSMVAIGISNIFGIELIENFRAPYMSRSIGEFWSRWHRSLSDWLKVYVYIPLGGNRNGYKRKIFNIFCVFLILGIWHGVGVGYIIWGILHAIYLFIENYFNKKNITMKIMLSRVIVLFEVVFAWFFFRAGSWNEIVQYTQAFLTNDFWEIGSIEIDKSDCIIFCISMVVAFFIEKLLYKNELLKFIRSEKIAKWGAIIYLLLVAIIIFGAYGGSYSSGLIYMQF